MQDDHRPAGRRGEKALVGMPPSAFAMASFARLRNRYSYPYSRAANWFGSLPHVRLSGDLEGDYVVLQHHAGGVLRIAPEQPKGRPRSPMQL